MVAGGPHCHSHDSQAVSASSCSRFAHVHCIPETRRGLVPSRSGFGSAAASAEALCLAAPPGRKARAVKGWIERRKPPVGRATGTVAGKSSSESRESQPLPHRSHLRGVRNSLAQDSGANWIGPATCCAVPTEAQRTIARPTSSSSKPARSEAERKMGVGQNPESVRGTWPHQPRILQSATADPKPGDSCRAPSASGGPKTFWPQQSIASDKSSKMMIEVFSGCTFG